MKGILILGVSGAFWRWCATIPVESPKIESPAAHFMHLVAISWHIASLIIIMAHSLQYRPTLGARTP